MGIDLGIFLTYVGAVLLVLIFGRIFLWPLKIVLKLALNSVLGGIVILVINAVGSGFGLMIPLNMITAVTVGVLGLPGAVMLILLNL